MGRLEADWPAQVEISLGLALISRFPNSVESLQERPSLQVCAYLIPPATMMMKYMMAKTTHKPTETKVQVFALLED